ncbi:MAG: S9 family peptidase [Actinomycetales bacterium]
MDVEAQQPPVAARHPVRTTLHGVERVDDYAWMRDRDAPELHEYLAAERRYYDARTARSRPLHNRLFSEMSARTLPADSSVSWSRGGPVYYTRTVAGKEYDLFCMSDCDLPASGPADDSSSTRDERVLLDVNEVAEGHDYVALGVCEPSPDGRLLAWSADTNGDERFTLRIRDLASGEDSEAIAVDSYYTCAWSAGSDALFFPVIDATNRPFQIWRHTIGEEAAVRTELVVEEPDARFELLVEATRDGALVLITAESRDTTEVSWLPADRPHATPTVVWPRRKAIEYAVDHISAAVSTSGRSELVVLTNEGAPEFRVVRVPLDAPGGTPVDLLAADPATRWESVTVIGHHAVSGGRRDAMPFLHIVDLTTGGSHVIEPPATGQVALARNADPTATVVRIRTESIVQPPEWYDVDLDSGERRLVKRLEVPTYEPERYVTERIWATAPDGEKVPVSLARRVDTPLDGTAPCLLWGYGSYESCDWPWFDASLLSLLDRGVVYAVAHVRGGGERGRGWWVDGHRGTKQNTFTDYVAVADTLADGIVDGDRIVTRGRSAGGLLQGVAMGLAPHRWAAVVAEVPFVDCVGSMLDETIPLTVIEWDEWGDPRRPDEFGWLMAYAPYENPPPGYRPPMLVTGSVHDPRVLVHEPAKWVARLRATAGPEATEELLFRVELGAGAHVGPAGRYGHLRYEAEVQAYVLGRLGLGG